MRTVCGVLVCGLLSAVAAAEPIVLRRGAIAAAFHLRVDIGAEATAATAALAWRSEDGVWIGTRHDALADVTVRLTPDDEGGVALDVELRYHTAARVNREAVVLATLGKASMLGRDLVWGPAPP